MSTNSPKQQGGKPARYVGMRAEVPTNGSNYSFPMQLTVEKLATVPVSRRILTFCVSILARPLSVEYLPGSRIFYVSLLVLLHTLPKRSEATAKAMVKGREVAKELQEGTPSALEPLPPLQIAELILTSKLMALGRNNPDHEREICPYRRRLFKTPSCTLWYDQFCCFVQVWPFSTLLVLI